MDMAKILLFVSAFVIVVRLAISEEYRNLLISDPASIAGNYIGTWISLFLIVGFFSILKKLVLMPFKKTEQTTCEDPVQI